jgi:(S)-3,5-dihydroxyphenylglycine transaminase
VEAAEKCGKRPRAVYLVPDFDNPTGTVLSRTTRQEIIAFCFSKGIVILEDNPYGMFRYEGNKEATMFSLDDRGCVIYLGTYSKTICPALRIGYAVIPDSLFGQAGSGSAFIQGLARAKSFISVNTSNITQAMVGALLLTEEYSLRKVIAPALERYRENRDAMVAKLSESFAGLRDRVEWNVPAGGFFLTVKLPFRFALREAEICAEQYGVLVMPLSFFALDDRHDCFVRMAFSNVTPALISSGIERFERFVSDHLDRRNTDR